MCYVDSDGESHWVSTEIDRDYEALKSARQATADQSNDARDEHGDDEGEIALYVMTDIINVLSMKAGILEEMMDDTLAVEDDEELEEEADAEVDKVLFDITNGKLGQAGSVQTELPVRSFSVKVWQGN